MNNQRALFYPLLREAVPVIRYRQMVYPSWQLDIVAAVSPPAYLAEGKDAAFLDEGEATGMLVSENFRKTAENCDCVLLSDCRTWEYSEYLLEIVNNLIWACKKRKNIYWITKLPEPYHNFFSSYSQKYSVVFSELEKAPVFLEIRELRNLQPLQTPLLTIAGMNEDCGEFGLQLGIKQQLEKDGYRVSYVGSNRFAPLLGGYVFPQETLESLPCSFEIKIKYLNAWLREIEIRESADLLLLGIPGGTMPIDEYNLNSGGYYAYLAGCAASADFGVLTLPCMEYPPAYFGQCRDVLKHKFNLPADCLCLSNIRITPSVLTEMKITEEKDIFPQDKVEKVMDSYRKKGIFLLNAAKQITYEAITQKLYDKLS